jgi:hypothetical protein
MDEDCFGSAGAGTVNGIWLFNASAFNMQKTLTATADQLRNVFHDIVVSAAGSIVMGYFVDGKQCGDIQGTLFTGKDVGQRYPFYFWYASKFRTAGTHTVEIKLGKMRQTSFLGLFKRAYPVWDKSFIYTIVITPSSVE